MTDADRRSPKSAPCPVCGKPAIVRYRPFCSPRCAQIDLIGSLSEVYVVPGSEESPNPDEPSREDEGG